MSPVFLTREGEMMNSAASAVTETVSNAFNNNANQALASLINKVTSGVDQATSFMASQIPDVIHQLLVYYLLSSLLTCLFCLLGTLLLPVAWWKIIKWLEKNMKLRGEGGTAITVLSGLCIVFGDIGLIVGFFSNFDWLKIWLAPKIWLIEYATTLVRTATGH